MKIFNRPFNAGGKYSRIGTYASYPEKIIGEKSINTLYSLHKETLLASLFL